MPPPVRQQQLMFTSRPCSQSCGEQEKPCGTALTPQHVQATMPVEAKWLKLSRGLLLLPSRQPTPKTSKCEMPHHQCRAHPQPIYQF